MAIPEPSDHEWRPHPRQEAFMQSTADEALLGGAAGGGKSDALIADAVRLMDHPKYSAILFRRTYPELEMSLIQRSRELLSGSATYNQTRKTWTFPSGARLVFGALEHESTVHRFQSAQFPWIGFDELTSFTAYQYDFLISRNRNVHGFPNVIRSATNPGDVGHFWVKKRFIDPMPANTKAWFVRKGLDDVRVDEGTPRSRSRRYFPSLVTDNLTLMAGDPDYIYRLEQLPPRERAMFLEGNWQLAAEGLVYEGFNPEVHVVDPFPIPRDWRRYRSIDFGTVNPFVCQWWAVDGDDRLYLYRELYEAQRLITELGPEIHALTEKEHISATVADHDAQERLQLERNHQIRTIPAWKELLPGIQAVTKKLQPDIEGRPGITVFRDCVVRVDQKLRSERKPTSTQEEFGLYQWAPVTEGHAPKEEPLKKDDHGMDGTRYMVTFLERLKSRQGRFRLTGDV